MLKVHYSYTICGSNYFWICTKDTIADSTVIADRDLLRISEYLIGELTRVTVLRKNLGWVRGKFWLNSENEKVG